MPLPALRNMMYRTIAEIGSRVRARPTPDNEEVAKMIVVTNFFFDDTLARQRLIKPNNKPMEAPVMVVHFSILLLQCGSCCE